MKFLIALAVICVVVVVVTVVWVAVLLRLRQRGAAPKTARANETGQRTTGGGHGKLDSARLGYRYDHGNVFVHGSTVWTGIKMRPTMDRHIGAEDIKGLVAEATQTLTGLLSSDEPVNVQYRLSHRPMDVREWQQDLLRHAWDPTPMYHAYVDGQAQYLHFSDVRMPTAYLLVQIDKLTPTKLGQIAQSANAAMMGGDDDVVPPHLAAEWEAAARKVVAHLQRTTKGEPITREDRMWLIRKPLHGHHSPVMDDFPKTKPWGEGEFALWVDFNADNHRKYLHTHILNSSVTEIDRAEDSSMTESYTACLAVADWDSEVYASQNTAWLRFFSDHQCEVSYRMEVIPHAAFYQRLKKINGNLRDEAQDRQKGGGEPDQHLVAEMIAADEAEREVRASRTPGLYSQIVIQVSAPTLDQLNERVELITREAKQESGLSIELIRPNRWHYRLVQSMLPGENATLLGGQVPFRRIGEPGVFGAGLPRVGTSIGDRVTVERGNRLGWLGNFIGDTDGTPVFHSPHSSIGRNSGGGVFIVGASGGGKSSLALLLFFQASESGVRTVVLDPKVDFAQFCYYLAFGPQVNEPGFKTDADQGILGTPESQFQPINRQFWDETQVINLAKAPAGALDPWNIAPSYEEGQQLARTVLNQFLSPADAESQHFKTEISSAFKTLKAEYQDVLKQERTRLQHTEMPDATDDVLDREARSRTPLPTLWRLVDIIQEADQDVQQVIVNESRAKVLLSPGFENMKKTTVVAQEFDTLRESRFARLAFAKNPGGLDTRPRRRTVFTLAGIELPKANVSHENWNDTERMGAGAMYLLVRFANQLLDTSGDDTGRTRPKMLMVDESYVVTALPAGQALLQQTLAQGRSYGLVTVLIDQLAKRLAQIESDKSETNASTNQVASVFAFQQRSEDDARAVVPLLTKHDVDGMANKILPEGMGGGLATGYSFYRDLDSNVARVRVDLLFRELQRAAETNPELRSIAQSHPVSADPYEWSYTSETEIEEQREVADARNAEVYARQAQEDAEPSNPGEDDDEAPADSVDDTANMVEAAE